MSNYKKKKIIYIPNQTKVEYGYCKVSDIENKRKVEEESKKARIKNK